MPVPALDSEITIRAAEAGDHDAIWSILEPTIRGGETYTLPRDLSREQALEYWFGKGHEVFVAELAGRSRELISCTPINKAAGRTWPTAGI